MGCVNSPSHTKPNALPPNSADTTINLGSSVPFNKNLSFISSQNAFQPDSEYI